MQDGSHVLQSAVLWKSRLGYFLPSRNSFLPPAHASKEENQASIVKKFDVFHFFPFDLFKNKVLYVKANRLSL